jgi:hypothetical protein
MATEALSTRYLFIYLLIFSQRTSVFQLPISPELTIRWPSVLTTRFTCPSVPGTACADGETCPLSTGAVTLGDSGVGADEADEEDPWEDTVED